MIKVLGLKKLYGNFEALKGISFEIKPSRITALLGPNGAGKTTTLRILSGYLNYDEGEIEFFGRKLNEVNIVDIKKEIGYIPENNPIYEDLEVIDYLDWIREVYGATKQSLKNVIDKCSIGDVCSKKISTLSKGYRQRVSLAKAMIHNPPVFLLDEPTTGLDPNQARQTRELIKNLSKDKTIVISTHILSEVEYLADDIIIINRGTIAIYGTKDEIINRFSKNSYILKTKDDDIDFSILKPKNILKQKNNEEIIWTIEFDDIKDMRREIVEFIKNKNIELLEFYKQNLTIDEIFKKITEESI